jgi:hypothetical protein
MRRLLVPIALTACARDAGPRGESPPAELGDLTHSLEPARAEFNAHRAQARFLTLLSPT